MNKSQFTLSVYNTLTGTYEVVEVTQHVHQEYRRTEWNIKKNNKRFYSHEIQFSGLICGENGDFEYFHEFVNENHNPESMVITKQVLQSLVSAFSKLNQEERELIIALFMDGKSERKYAAEMEIPAMTIHDRKIKALKKLRNLMKF